MKRRYGHKRKDERKRSKRRWRFEHIKSGKLKFLEMMLEVGEGKTGASHGWKSGRDSCQPLA